MSKTGFTRSNIFHDRRRPSPSDFNPVGVEDFDDDGFDEDPVASPPVKKRSKSARNPIVVVLNFMFTVGIALLIAGGVFVFSLAEKFNEPGPNTQDQTVMISRGSSLASIAELVQVKKLVSDADLFGVIDNATIFLVSMRLLRPGKSAKAGEYEIPAKASMAQIADILIDGKSIQYSFTVPEGWATAQVLTKLKADENLVGEIESMPGEGEILPETYLFLRGTTRQQVLDQMVKASSDTVAKVWAERNPDIPLKSPRELVILASIVEKETGKAEERSEVAAVFVNRLKKGMRLETDPTILYGLYKGEAWTRPRTILRSELRKKNAYNTYQIDGLPPGPIANPGRAALEAVANPPETKYLFFVADGTGGHQFAETLRQHNRNVANWRKIERERKEAAQQQNQE